MPPRLAFLMSIGFSVWLFRIDRKHRTGEFTVHWSILLWLLIIGSRPVAFWLGLIGIGGGGSTNSEGNIVNLIVLVFLLIVFVRLLLKRGINFGEIISGNKAIIALYLFLALSAIWSEYSFATVKRVFKDFGSVLAVLLLLSEKDPLGAIRAVFVRASYILFPLSVVFIKYFPEIGRGYSHGGGVMYTGVTSQKNSLGQLVLVLGLVILWDLFEIYHDKTGGKQNLRKKVNYGMLLIGFWLLHMCQSKTSALCLVTGGVLIWLSKYLVRLHHPSQVLLACAAAGLLFFGLNFMFGISGKIIEALGRDASLTGRANIWHVVMSQPINPLIGSGYLAFWDSQIGIALAEDELDGINSVHNGYLEMYLDGGLSGVCLLGILLISAGSRASENLLAGTLFGRTAFAFWIVALIYNYSESSFFRLGPLWFVFLLIAIRYPSPFNPPLDRERNSPQGDSCTCDTPFGTYPAG